MHDLGHDLLELYEVTWIVNLFQMSECHWKVRRISEVILTFGTLQSRFLIGFLLLIVYERISYGSFLDCAHRVCILSLVVSLSLL